MNNNDEPEGNIFVNNYFDFLVSSNENVSVSFDNTLLRESKINFVFNLGSDKDICDSDSLFDDDLLPSVVSLETDSDVAPQAEALIPQVENGIVASSPKTFDVYCHNMSGMRSSLRKFRHDVSNCPYDAILVNETWLQGHIGDREIIPDGWTLFRKDRVLVSDDDVVGGGVFILCNSDLKCRILEVDAVVDSCKFDIVAVEVDFVVKKLILVCFYLPPKSEKEDYLDLAEQIRNIYKYVDEVRDDVIIYGDANLEDILWVQSEYSDKFFDPTCVNVKYEDFLAMLLSLGLHQINNFVNNYGNVLDNVFTNAVDNLVIDKAVLTLTGKTSVFHNIITLRFLQETHSGRDESLQGRILKYDFTRADYDGINRELSLLDLEGYSGSARVDYFYERLSVLLEKYVPKRLVTLLSCAKHLDKPLRMLRNQRNRAFRKMKLSQTTDDLEVFLRLRDQFEQEEALAVAMHDRKLMLNILDQPKDFWNYVNEFRNGRGYPSNMCFNGLESSDPAVISEYFSDNLKSVFKDPISFQSEDFLYMDSHDARMSEVVLTLDDILEGINGLDASKGPGHDGIPPSFLISTKLEIARHLLLLFNESLATGSFPDVWKLAQVIPVFKSGFRSEVVNYRGISILPAFCKLFEKIVARKLRVYLRPMIDQAQHGFDEGKSTLTNLAEYTSFLRTELGARHQVDSIYTDFSKAFDVVDHRLLIFKLSKYGITGPLLSWIESYLKNRRQVVKFKNFLSRTVEVTSGVPQGSVLGPLFFLIFINDLPKMFSDCNYSFFADDLKLFRRIGSDADGVILQRNLTSLGGWSCVNGMFLHAGKCSMISFFKGELPFDCKYTIGDNELGRVKVIRDLGVILDEKLTFKPHVDRIVNSSHSVWGFVKRMAKFFKDPYVTKRLYCSLVQSILEYCSIIWGPYTQELAIKIESVQKQFLIFALKPLGFQGYVLPTYKSRLLLLNMTTLENRRELASALFAFDLVRENIAITSLSDRVIHRNVGYSLRRQRPLLEELHSSNFKFNDCISRAIRTFNRYSCFYSDEISKDTFRKRILLEMKSIRNCRNGM